MVRSKRMHGIRIGGRRYDGQRGQVAQPLAVLVALLLSHVAYAEPLRPPSKFQDTIIARAQEAWESDNGDIMFIRGDLQLRGSHWHIYADTARVEGKLGDPARVVVDGSPARIVVSRDSDAQALEGRSRHLDFDPRAKKLRLDGAATIVKGQESISSESIRYSLDRNTFEAGSHGRVKVVTGPHATRK
jgi:lipopolysaccharide transport protein LptA